MLNKFNKFIKFNNFNKLKQYQIHQNSSKQSTIWKSYAILNHLVFAFENTGIAFSGTLHYSKSRDSQKQRPE